VQRDLELLLRRFDNTFADTHSLSTLKRPEIAIMQFADDPPALEVPNPASRLGLQRG